jgi:flagellin-like protein
LEKINMKHNGNEKAVSPVIAVILLIAITVILAAVVAGLVFGMAGNQQHGRALGVTGQYNAGEVILVLNSGTNEDVGLLDRIDVTINGVQQPPWSPEKKGDTTTYAGPFDHPCTVGMIAHYSPNDQTVILTTLNL